MSSQQPPTISPHQSPFDLSHMLLDCLSCQQQELVELEKKYWAIVNYYPSYASYSCSCDFPSSCLVLLSFYLDESMPAKALSLAKSIQKENASDLYANLLLAKVLMEIPSARRQAEELLRKWNAKEKSQVEVAYLYARCLVEEKKVKEAIAVWVLVGELMIRLSPIVDENTSNEVKQLLCECYLKNGDMIPYFLLQHGVWCVCWEFSLQLIQREFSHQFNAISHFNSTRVLTSI